jgi:HEPN domain-containing protein
MNRMDFQELANLRAREAEALLAVGFWDGAFYLAGYAIECGLKACISKTFSEHDFPPKPKTVTEFYTHELPTLLRHSGVQEALVEDRKSRADLNANWGIVSQWKVEEARYKIDVNEATARAFVSAVTDPLDGVLTWIKDRW